MGRAGKVGVDLMAPSSSRVKPSHPVPPRPSVPAELMPVRRKHLLKIHRADAHVVVAEVVAGVGTRAVAVVAKVVSVVRVADSELRAIPKAENETGSSMTSPFALQLR